MLQGTNLHDRKTAMKPADLPYLHIHYQLEQDPLHNRLALGYL